MEMPQRYRAGELALHFPVYLAGEVNEKIEELESQLIARDRLISEISEAWFSAWSAIEATLGSGSRKGRAMDVIPKSDWDWMMGKVRVAQAVSGMGDATVKSVGVSDGV